MLCCTNGASITIRHHAGWNIPGKHDAYWCMQLVCFDVDSTFCTDESIDEIAAFVGKGEEVAALTRQAMGGTMPFQDALKMRLDCMNASKRDIMTFREAHPPQLSPGAAAAC